MQTMFYGVCETNIVKPIITIYRITRNWAIESIEYFRDLWSIWNYPPIFINKNLTTRITTPAIWVLTQEWLNSFKELYLFLKYVFTDDFVDLTTLFRWCTYFSRAIEFRLSLKCLLRHIFLWWIALRNCPFIYGTWFVLRNRCFRGALILMTEDSKCCWAHAISSTSSKTSQTWKGTLLRSLLNASWSKYFMDLYVIRRLSG